MALDATGRALFRAALTSARRLQRCRPDGVDNLIRGALPQFDALRDATPECTVRRVARERGHDHVALALRFTQSVRRRGQQRIPQAASQQARRASGTAHLSSTPVWGRGSHYASNMKRSRVVRHGHNAVRRRPTSSRPCLATRRSRPSPAPLSTASARRCGTRRRAGCELRARCSWSRTREHSPPQRLRRLPLRHTFTAISTCRCRLSTSAAA
jgi:hypothetical protein